MPTRQDTTRTHHMQFPAGPLPSPSLVVVGLSRRSLSRVSSLSLSLSLPLSIQIPSVDYTRSTINHQSSPYSPCSVDAFLSLNIYSSSLPTSTPYFSGHPRYGLCTTRHSDPVTAQPPQHSRLDSSLQTLLRSLQLNKIIITINIKNACSTTPPTRRLAYLVLSLMSVA